MDAPHTQHLYIQCYIYVYGLGCLGAVLCGALHGTAGYNLCECNTLATTFNDDKFLFESRHKLMRPKGDEMRRTQCLCALRRSLESLVVGLVFLDRGNSSEVVGS